MLEQISSKVETLLSHVAAIFQRLEVLESAIPVRGTIEDLRTAVRITAEELAKFKTDVGDKIVAIHSEFMPVMRSIEKRIESVEQLSNVLNDRSAATKEKVEKLIARNEVYDNALALIGPPEPEETRNRNTILLRLKLIETNVIERIRTLEENGQTRSRAIEALGREFEQDKLGDAEFFKACNDRAEALETRVETLETVAQVVGSLLERVGQLEGERGRVVELANRVNELGQRTALPDFLSIQAGPQSNPQRLAGNDDQTAFNLTIGELDLILSKLMGYARLAADGGLEMANRQTLKHHAEDMKLAAESIFKNLNVVSSDVPTDCSPPEERKPLEDRLREWARDCDNDEDDLITEMEVGRALNLLESEGGELFEEAETMAELFGLLRPRKPGKKVKKVTFEDFIRMLEEAPKKATSKKANVSLSERLKEWAGEFYELDGDQIGAKKLKNFLADLEVEQGDGVGSLHEEAYEAAKRLGCIPAKGRTVADFFDELEETNVDELPKKKPNPEKLSTRVRHAFDEIFNDEDETDLPIEYIPSQIRLKKFLKTLVSSEQLTYRTLADDLTYDVDLEKFSGKAMVEDLIQFLKGIGG